MDDLILTESDRRRFEKFLKRDEETGCLLFTGHITKHGYGGFGVKVPGRRMVKVNAHRVAFLLAGGVLTEERPLVIHSCDNRPCCEPAHLRAGTPAENNEDMQRRKRGRKSRLGYPRGVCKAPHCPGYTSTVRERGRTLYLGYYLTIEEAHAAAERHIAARLR